MAPLRNPGLPASVLAEYVRDTRQRTFDLVADLTDEQLLGPRISIINPMIWEIGHMAWFQEKWILRGVCGEAPIRRDGDALYDSSAVPHDTRWDLPLPSREATLAYMRDVRDRVLAKLDSGDPSPDLAYHVLYSVFHEDMHTEAFTYTRQTLTYPAPRLLAASDRPTPTGGGPLLADVEVPGGTFMLGGVPDAPFVFDNEKWAHPVEVKPFAIARAPVTQAEFAAFVDEGGYGTRAFWSEEGWTWRTPPRGGAGTAGADHPLYWRHAGSGRWERRDFAEWTALEPHRPVIHVNWHEAEAYCRWARRRLPTEAEWEMAAAASTAGAADGPGRHSARQQKRCFPWGDEPPTPARTNMDWRAMGCVDVGALPEGDSAFGCRQMMGNVWEWTCSTFGPYPGFEPDPYKEYSEPWFGTRKVLKGGCWATRSRMLRNTWRNYFTPDRRDTLAGFRTCRVEK